MFAALIAVSSVAKAAEIHIGAELKERISGDAAAMNALRSNLGLNSEWTIARITVDSASLDVIPKVLDMPPIGDEIVLSTPRRRDNCSGTEDEYDYEESFTYENSVTNTKTDHFGVGVSAKVTWTTEAGVQLKVFNFGTSVQKEIGFSFDYDYTTEASETRSSTKTISETDKIKLPPWSVTHIAAYGRPQQGSVPYTISFVPKSTTSFTIELRGTGRVCMYEHSHYNGIEYCTRNSSYVLPNLNDEVTSLRVLGNVTATMFRDTSFKGDSITYSRSNSNVGDAWNDEFSSVRVTKKDSTKEVTWSVLRSILTNSKLPADYQVSGTLNVNSNNGVRVRKHQIVGQDNLVVVRYCGSTPDFQVPDGTPLPSTRQKLQDLIDSGAGQFLDDAPMPHAPTLLPTN